MTILGISTNTRLVGMAIITDGELVDYKVKLFTSPWSPKKVTQIITSLEPCVRQFSIKKVVLSIPPSHYQTNEFRKLNAEIREFFEVREIEVIAESVAMLHAFCKENGRKTKKKIMRVIAAMFPELQMFNEREMRNKNKYYVKLFEAIGLAVFHS